MEGNSNSSTQGCACCAGIVAVGVFTVSTALSGYLVDHLIRSALLAIAIFAAGGFVVTFLMEYDRKERDEPVADPHDSVGPTEPIAERKPPGRHLAPRGAKAKDRPDLESLGDLCNAGLKPTGTESASAGEVDARAATPDSVDHKLARKPHGDDVRTPAAETDPVQEGEAVSPESFPHVEWTPRVVKQGLERALRRDGWAVFRSRFEQIPGDLEIIAGQGPAIIAVKCPTVKNESVLDEKVVRRLLDSPFDIHGIVEVLVVAPSGATTEARSVAAASVLRVHIAENEELDAWVNARARLEPQWGLIRLED